MPLLIFANKQDIGQALAPDKVNYLITKIMEQLKIGDIKTRKWTITACSAKTSEGI